MLKGSWSRMEFKEASWLRSLQSVWFTLQEQPDGQLADVPHRLRRIIKLEETTRKWRGLGNCKS